VGIFGTKEERTQRKAARQAQREKVKAAAAAAAQGRAQAHAEQMQHRNELAKKAAHASGSFQGLYVLPDQLIRLDKAYAQSYPISGASASIDLHPPIMYKGTTYYSKADLHVEGDGFAWTIPFRVGTTGQVPNEAHRFVNALKVASRK
jgi:hypothetical protein